MAAGTWLEPGWNWKVAAGTWLEPGLNWNIAAGTWLPPMYLFKLLIVTSQSHREAREDGRIPDAVIQSG